MSALLQGIIKSALTSGQLGQDIATTALKEIFGVDSSASAGGPAEAAPAALPAGGASSASDNIQFNETGEAIDLGKRSVLQEGFSEGLAVRKILETGADQATQAANARVQWQITKVNMDGSVLLTKILPDGAIDKGNTTSVAVDDFLGKFKEVVPLELDPRLPFTIDSEESIYQGAVFQAMYKKQGIAPVDGVFRLVLKPSKAVISLRSWSTGTLVSLPLTTYSNLKALDLSEEDPSLFTATFQDINGVPQSYAVHAPGANKDFVCTAFQFRTIEDESKPQGQPQGYVHFSLRAYVVIFRVPEGGYQAPNYCGHQADRDRGRIDFVQADHKGQGHETQGQGRRLGYARGQSQEGQEGLVDRQDFQEEVMSVVAEQAPCANHLHLAAVLLR